MTRRRISYSTYCRGLSYLEKSYATQGVSESGILDWIKGSGLPGDLMKVFKDIGENLQLISKEIKVEFSKLVQAFRSKDLYQLLRAFKFNIKLIFSALKEATAFLGRGLHVIAKRIHDGKIFQKIKSGVMKMDQLLDQFPLLKKITGPALAGLLLWMWLQASFVGDMEFDLNIGTIIAALHGSFSLADIFASPQGLTFLFVVTTGVLTGGGLVAWAGHSVGNLLLALVYTGTNDPEVKAKLKGLIKR